MARCAGIVFSKNTSVDVVGSHHGKSHETFFTRSTNGIILTDLKGSWSLFGRRIKNGGQKILKQGLKIINHNYYINQWEYNCVINV